MPANHVAAILDRLDALERSFAGLTGVLKDQNRQYQAVSRSGTTALPELGISPGPFINSVIFEPLATPASQTMQSVLNAQADSTMAIPLSHSTTTSNLLQSGPVKAFLGEYSPNIFLHIETCRPVPYPLSLNLATPGQTQLPVLFREETDILIRVFFESVNRLHPVLDQALFYALYADALDKGLYPNLHSALILVVLALASAANDTPEPRSSSWMPGVRFFTPALDILLREGLQSVGTNQVLSQALYLAALYYGYLARPLQAWRLVHMASTEVQHYWSR